MRKKHSSAEFVNTFFNHSEIMDIDTKIGQVDSKLDEIQEETDFYERLKIYRCFTCACEYEIKFVMNSYMKLIF